MLYNGLEIARLNITFGARILETSKDTIECFLEFHIEVVFDKSSREVFVINRREEFLERVHMRLNVAQQTDHLQQHDHCDDHRDCDVIRREYRPGQ